MLVVITAGLVANIATAWVLTRGGGHTHELDTRVALLHVLGVLLGSVAPIAAVIIMITTGWYVANPRLSAA